MIERETLKDIDGQFKLEVANAEMLFSTCLQKWTVKHEVWMSNTVLNNEYLIDHINDQTNSKFKLMISGTCPGKLIFVDIAVCDSKTKKPKKPKKNF